MANQTFSILGKRISLLLGGLLIALALVLPASSAFAQDAPKIAYVNLQRALNEFIVEGISTNVPFLLRILDDPRFGRGELDTHFLDDLAPASESRS